MSYRGNKVILGLRLCSDDARHSATVLEERKVLVTKGSLKGKIIKLEEWIEIVKAKRASIVIDDPPIDVPTKIETVEIKLSRSWKEYFSCFKK